MAPREAGGDSAGRAARLRGLRGKNLAMGGFFARARSVSGAYQPVYVSRFRACMNAAANVTVLNATCWR
ncbi:hypothetical protein KCP73_14060 [Salmonella enterica subsp. enterica]|nr:hypothetical protein KCP73_14060 [Salmonella enterica subsp. enterica]